MTDQPGTGPEQGGQPLVGRADAEPRGEQGFRVRVEGPSAIYQELKTVRNSILYLGETPMDNQPIAKAQVLAFPNGKTIAMRAVLQPAEGAISWYGEERQFIGRLKDGSLGQKFKLKEMGDTLYVLDDQGQQQFAVHRGDSGGVYITAGGEHGTVPSELAGGDDFQGWITRYASVIQETAASVYQAKGKSSPDVELVLRPPERPVRAGVGEGSGGSISDLLKGLDPKDQLRQLVVVEEKPDISFDQVGGQTAAKDELESVAFALSNPDLYQEWGTTPPKGIMMFGPPGTGKTLMAKALASEADAAFIYAPVSQLTSMWHGESEKQINRLFEIAREHERAIIFFDEVDAFGNRSEANEASRRMLNSLLENMNGLGDEGNKGVMVICATNKPEDLDDAFKRAGRIDRWIEVPLPDQEGLQQIFSIHMTSAEAKAGQPLFSDIDQTRLSIEAERLKLSGADVAEIVRRTLESKVRQQAKSGQKPGPVTMDEVLMSLSSYEHVKRAKAAIGFQPR
jgi:AAA+ superfamily predicted ATPase